MDIKKAIETIKDLSDGLDPETKQPLSTDSIYQRPTIIRALCTAFELMDRAAQNRERKRRLPSNAGKPWTRSEDAKLCQRFDRGEKVFSMAMQHNRTVGSIAARLVRLNKLSADDLPRLVGPQRASSIIDYETARKAAAKENSEDYGVASKTG